VIGPLLLFQLAPHAQLQLQALPVTDGDEHVRLRRARAGVDGRFARELRLDLLVQFFDAVDSPAGESPARLLDAKVRWDRHDWAVLGAGLGKVPVSRSNLMAEHDLMLPERPFSVESSESGGLVPERRVGATIEADLGMVGYQAGFFRGAEGLSSDEGEGWLAAARLQLLPIGPVGATESALDRGDPWFDWPRVALGGSFAYQDRAGADRSVGEGDLMFKFRGLALGGEVLAGRAAVGNEPARDLLGAWGQAGYFLIQDVLEVAGRYDWTDAGVRAATGGASVFLWKGRVKLQASHTHGDTPRGEDETILQAGLQL
jgi:hypothetical protein